VKSMRPLAEMVRQGYRQPYGTPLTLDSFEILPNGAGWGVSALDADKVLRSYVISSPPPDRQRSTASADGVTLRYRDPFTKREFLDALPTDWADFIMLRDAEGRNVSEQTEWSGFDIDSMMHRVAHDVVVSDLDEENLGNFADLVEFQAWLDNKLRATNVKVTAFECTSRVEDDEGLFLRRRHYHPDNPPEAGNTLDGDEPLVLNDFCACVFHPDQDAANWQMIQGDSRALQPAIRVGTEGTQIVSYCSDFAASVRELRKKFQLTTVAGLKASRSGTGNDRSVWWGFYINGTDLAMVFPSSGWNLVLKTDLDGALVDFDAATTGYRAGLNRANDKFSRRWGRWMDPNVALSDAELAQGLHEIDHLLGAS